MMVKKKLPISKSPCSICRFREICLNVIIAKGLYDNKVRSLKRGLWRKLIPKDAHECTKLGRIELSCVGIYLERPYSFERTKKAIKRDKKRVKK